MLNPFGVPVLKNRQWRFLTRDIVAAHPRLQRESSAQLQRVLDAPVAVAWWIATFAPELLDRQELHVLLPGVGVIECSDEGRWFSFLPALLGRKDLRVRFTLVGDELSFHDGGLASTVGKSLFQLRHEWQTPLAAAVKDRPVATIHNGLLRELTKADFKADACIFLAPGFAQNWQGWFTDADLLAVLRSPAAAGVMPYSRMDALADMHALHVCGLLPEVPELKRNPFAREHEMSRFIGCYAQYAFAWLQRTHIDFRLAEDELLELESVEEYLRDEFRNTGDEGLERLGSRWEVASRDTGKSDAILVLPGQLGILESSRLQGEFDEDGFRPFEQERLVPAEVVAQWPAEPFLLSRLLWAARVHKEWAEPARDEMEGDEMEEDEGEEDDPEGGGRLFGNITAEDMNKMVGDFASQVLGKKVDGKDFLRQMRVQGGPHGPTHLKWYDLFETLGWRPENYQDEPGRLQPAMSVGAPRRRVQLPVICEAYSYFPDDDGDELAKEALAAVKKTHPGGALLVFKMMPYQEVDGHKYSFGGMVFWQGAWHAFALNQHMNSLDDVLDQVESGFIFGKAAPAFADEGAALAFPFNLLCQGLDPNQPREMVGLRSGKWVTPMPG